VKGDITERGDVIGKECGSSAWTDGAGNTVAEPIWCDDDGDDDEEVG